LLRFSVKDPSASATPLYPLPFPDVQVRCELFRIEPSVSITHKKLPRGLVCAGGFFYFFHFPLPGRAVLFFSRVRHDSFFSSSPRHPFFPLSCSIETHDSPCQNVLFFFDPHKQKSSLHLIQKKIPVFLSSVSSISSLISLQVLNPPPLSRFFRGKASRRFFPFFAPRLLLDLPEQTRSLCLRK